MKFITTLIIAGFTSLVINTVATAQSTDGDWNMILIREDHVIPSLVSQYEAALMDLKQFLYDENETEFQYLCHMQDNYSFTHVIPVNSGADIENLKLLNWVKQKNNSELNLIYDHINETVESYRYYMVQYHPELSYVPASEDWIKGLPYRKWSFYYFYPGSEDAVRDILTSWRGVYDRYNVPYGYRIFEGSVGLDQPVFIFTNWAKDPLDHMEKLYENMKLLGKDGANLWKSTMQYVRKVETIEGWYLPQYSYIKSSEK